jgi:predicted nucleotide-binding protein
LRQNLDAQFEVLLETEDVFQPSQAILDDLLKTRLRVEYAAFVLTAEDVRRSQSKHSGIARDNLIFELGLFMGALGRERVFTIVPKLERPDLPSDLLGITAISYREPARLGWQAAMGPAATRLKQIIDKRGKSSVDINLVETGQWSYEFSEASPLIKLFLNTNHAS